MCPPSSPKGGCNSHSLPAACVVLVAYRMQQCWHLASVQPRCQGFEVKSKIWGQGCAADCQEARVLAKLPLCLTEGQNL